MYLLSVPVMLNAKTYDPEKILADLRYAEANRVVLAIDTFTTDRAAGENVFEKLEKAIPFFRKNGYEVAVWAWAFAVSGENTFTPITGFSGRKSADEKCPLDPDFSEFVASRIRRIASMNPDLILFDDDLRLGFHDSGCGCLCERHRAAMGAPSEKELPAAKLFESMFSGKKNPLRSAYLKAAGNSLKAFCRHMRAAVDSVNPNVRLGICSCMSVWDTDGADTYTLARLLAGNTKPFVRLIGAPYWAENKSWGNRLADVIELERMERGWYQPLGTDADPETVTGEIEILSEADAYPRPRFRVPAAYLEIFDTALRADGRLDGIHKYMLDYTSSTAYERGYLDKHHADKSFAAAIEASFAGKNAVGVRVYEALHKLEDADFTGEHVTPESVQNLFFSHAARLLAAGSIPSVHHGTGCAGIAFGENARHLPPEAFEKPLILDIRAAKILRELGVDVGLDTLGDAFVPAREYFPDENEYTALYAPPTAFAYAVTPKSEAKVQSYFETADGAHYPASYIYQKADGARFLVYTFRGDTAHEEIYRNYMRPRSLAKALEAFGAPLPFVCHGNPDLYLLAKGDTSSLAVGLWNCHADSAERIRMQLNEPYAAADFCGCTGRLDTGGNVLWIDRIEAYGKAFAVLCRA